MDIRRPQDWWEKLNISCWSSCYLWKCTSLAYPPLSDTPNGWNLRPNTDQSGTPPSVPSSALRPDARLSKPPAMSAPKGCRDDSAWLSMTQHDSARLDLSGSSVSNFFHIIFTCWDRWTFIAWGGGLGIVRLVGRLAITGLRQRGLGAAGCFSMGFKWVKHGDIENMMSLMVISWDVNRIYSLVMTNSLLLNIAI